MVYAIHAAILTTGISIALVLWYILRKRTAENLIQTAERRARQLAEESARQAETIRREAALEAKDRFYSLKNDLEKQIRDKRQDLQTLERRLNQKEENLERKLQYLETRERELTARERVAEANNRELQEARKRADQLIVEQKRVLEKMKREGPSCEASRTRPDRKRPESSARWRKKHASTARSSHARSWCRLSSAPQPKTWWRPASLSFLSPATT
jgi:predicted RNase H-like nuclease (RuvC/YqgF family)